MSKTFKELAEKARQSPWYEFHGAILSLTEDKNEKPLMDIFESKLSRLTTLERKLEEGKKFMIHTHRCQMVIQDGGKCVCGLSSFLSTLEGEKGGKE